MDIRTSPEQTEQLGIWLEQHGIAWSVMIEDVGVLMDAEKVTSLSCLLLKHELRSDFSRLHLAREPTAHTQWTGQATMRWRTSMAGQIFPHFFTFLRVFILS